MFKAIVYSPRSSLCTTNFMGRTIDKVARHSGSRLELHKAPSFEPTIPPSHRPKPFPSLLLARAVPRQ